MNARFRLALPALLLGCVFAAAGCPSAGAVKEEGAARPVPLTERKSVLEVLGALQENMNKLADLKCRINVRVIDQGDLAPASAKDTLRARVGKAFNKIFPIYEVSGTMALEQARPREPARMRFLAYFLGSDRVLNFLADGDLFWISMPDPALGPRGRRIYRGSDNPLSPRVLSYPAIRPQDILDLYTYPELFTRPDQPTPITFMETWPRYYIVTVLDIQRRNIYSRIWIDRTSLQVAYHQIFEADGTILAEARFRSYQAYKSSKGDVYLPSVMLLIWPRDELVLEITMSEIEINTTLKREFFKPPSEAGAVVETIPSRMPSKEPEKPAP